MQKVHYHVVVNMPGYLPDNLPTTHKTLADARYTAKAEADGFRGDYDSDGKARYKVTGNMRDGYVIEERQTSAVWVININPCWEDECLEYIDE